MKYHSDGLLHFRPSEVLLTGLCTPMRVEDADAALETVSDQLHGRSVRWLEQLDTAVEVDSQFAAAAEQRGAMVAAEAILHGLVDELAVTAHAMRGIAELQIYLASQHNADPV